MDRQREMLEARAADAAQGAGLRRLRQVWMGMVKGQVGLRVEIWRMGLLRARSDAQRKVEEAMRGRVVDGAVSIVRSVLGRLARGATGSRVLMWMSILPP